MNHSTVGKDVDVNVTFTFKSSPFFSRYSFTKLFILGGSSLTINHCHALKLKYVTHFLLKKLPSTFNFVDVFTLSAVQIYSASSSLVGFLIMSV